MNHLNYIHIQVEGALTTYNNLIHPSSYDETTMNAKKNLLDALDGLTASMCKGYTVGEPAGVASSSYVTIVTVNQDSSDLATRNVVLGSSEVDVGASVGGQFTSYSCGDGDVETCHSVCISSWEVRFHLKTALNACVFS